MEQENIVKNWLTASVFEYSCKKHFISVIEKVLKDKELSSDLHISFADSDVSEKQKVKPIFLLIEILRHLLSSVESFASETNTNGHPWNSDALPKIISLLEKTYEQCEFISIKKFFSLLFQLKFLDLMHLLRSNLEAAVLMQKLNSHFPRGSTQKASLEKQFFIENPKILVKVEESCNQCRRLILKLATDTTYRSIYMKEQFSNDMKKMMADSVTLLKEVISNLNSNVGCTAIEKHLQNASNEPVPDDLGSQLLLDYLQPEITPESLLKFLNELEPALEPPSGGFSSCLLPFDTLSECSDVAMDSDCDESGSESCSEDSSDEKDKTLVDIKL